MKLLSLEAYLVKMKFAGGVMKQIEERVIPEDFTWHEKQVLWCWKPEAYKGERKALVKLVLEANE